MKVRVWIVLSLCLNITSFADSATQTDWHEGGRSWVPGSRWGNSFYDEFGIFYSIPSQISLRETPEHSITDGLRGSRSIYLADIDNDGYNDIVSGISPGISWWENIDGSGLLWSEQIVDSGCSGARSVASMDLDSDGDFDVLAACFHDDTISWWENTDGSGTTWDEHIVDGDITDPSYIFPVDIDNDEDVDIVGSAWWDNKIYWWENTNGCGTSWVAHAIDTQLSKEQEVYSTDIDTDGDMDILIAADTPGRVSWWENGDTQGTVWIEHVVDDSFTGAASAQGMDMDSDGDQDILCSSSAYQFNRVVWWENDGGSGTSWIEHPVDTGTSGVYSLLSEDIDLDGDLDIIGFATWDKDVIWWENKDSGISWEKHIVEGEFSDVLSVCVGDMNGDGDIDFIGSNSGDVCWWDYLDGYPSVGVLESRCLYLQNDPGWGTIDWSAEIPSGTSVTFMVRSCDSPDMEDMGEWSDTLYAPGSLTSILGEGDSYFQYKAILSTSYDFITPILNDVTVGWLSLGSGEGEQALTKFYPISPNPCSSLQVKFELSETLPVIFSVFDLSGRLIHETNANELSLGIHCLDLGNFLPGIYFCRMISNDFAATNRFAVLE